MPAGFDPFYIRDADGRGGVGVGVDDAGNSYFIGETVFFSIDANGDVRWENNVYAGQEASVLWDSRRDVLWAAVTGNGLMKFDPDTGSHIDTVRSDARGEVLSWVPGNDLILYATHQSFNPWYCYVLNPGTGSTLLEVEGTSEPTDLYYDPDHDQLLVTTLSGGVVAYNMSDGSEAYEALGSTHSVIYVDGYLIVGDNDTDRTVLGYSDGSSFTELDSVERSSNSLGYLLNDEHVMMAGTRTSSYPTVRQLVREGESLKVDGVTDEANGTTRYVPRRLYYTPDAMGDTIVPVSIWLSGNYRFVAYDVDTDVPLSVFVFEKGQPVASGNPASNSFSYIKGDLIDDWGSSDFSFISGRGLGEE